MQQRGAVNLSCDSTERPASIAMGDESLLLSDEGEKAEPTIPTGTEDTKFAFKFRKFGGATASSSSPIYLSPEDRLRKLKASVWKGRHVSFNVLL